MVLPPPAGRSGRRPTREIVEELSRQSELMLSGLRSVALEGAVEKTLDRRWSVNEVARMTRRSRSWIVREEKAGNLPEPALSENGRRTGYTLEHVNHLRDVFGTNPYRQPGDPVTRLGFQNFKGGVGKTIDTVHAAQYFAREGYRTLLIDCDSQASATMLFGLRPGIDVDGEGTLLPFLTAEADSIAPAIRATHWDRLDLIPASLELYSAEYVLARQAVDGEGDMFNRLHEGIAAIEQAYDVIIIDSPPSLGLISLSVLRALTGLIVPCPPAMVDLHSTGAFFESVENLVDAVGAASGAPLELDFLRVLISKHAENRAAGDFLVGSMIDHYQESLMRNHLVLSAEIENAASNLQSVYELPRPSSSSRTYRRCLESLDAVFSEVEELVVGCWPSRQSGGGESEAAERLSVERITASPGASVETVSRSA